MTDLPPAQRRGWSWKALVAVLVLLVMTTIGVGIAWYFSTADLTAVRDLAAKRGIPTTWAAFAKPLADARHLAAFEVEEQTSRPNHGAGSNERRWQPHGFKS